MIISIIIAILLMILIYCVFGKIACLLIQDLFHAGKEVSDYTKSEKLQSKFISLGNMRGKTLDEIVNVVGKYTECKIITTDTGENCYEVRWVLKKYLMGILFDMNKTFKNIKSEVIINQINSNDLRYKLSSMGDLKGKTFKEVVSVIGIPMQSLLISDTSGKRCYRKIWKSNTYEVKMVFEPNGLFRHIEEENTLK